MPTINDAHLLMGVLNKDDYLGGGIKVNVDKSYRVFKEKVAYHPCPKHSRRLLS